jgi:hypothetical protein
MAKGQKKSNREIRKPKQAKAKPEAATRSFLEVAAGPRSNPGAKRPTG